ncbi:diphosphoinositol polyphosphate phosphohydrolase 1-like isoform X2 [Tachypleus tridentatus]|uniref:diphosphoinositol polyphosphate phosphohydrolase 1-like isoform X2 n=1 Tax=Tachypleus tridentatus TaxID=6853 RepID=UPI003FD49951
MKTKMRVNNDKHLQSYGGSAARLRANNAKIRVSIPELGITQIAHWIYLQQTTNKEVLLVTSGRVPGQWIVPGGGLEPDEEPSIAAIREVMEEAGVRGTLGRFLGTFENSERKHRTSVYVLLVTEELEVWEESQSRGRKRKWFPIQEAVKVLAEHKPVQCKYLKLLLKSNSFP